MNIKSPFKPLVSFAKSSVFQKAKLQTSNGKKTNATSTKKDQIKKLQAEKKKKAQELAKLQKSTLPKDEKERRIKALQKEIRLIDTSILRLSTPTKNTKKKTINLKG